MGELFDFYEGLKSLELHTCKQFPRTALLAVMNEKNLMASSKVLETQMRA